MRDRLIELINNADVQINGNISPYRDYGIENLADTILADGWIRPLLRTGQTVYRVSKNRMWEVKIWKVEICGGTVSYIDNYDKSFLERHIGKGVFLTREEAEAKLKEGGQG